MATENKLEITDDSVCESCGENVDELTITYDTIVCVGCRPDYF